jgi:isocitrate dehydrogenase (NAD+)
VTTVHKANIMKLGDGLFLKTVAKWRRLPEIVNDDRIVDNACMQLVINPTQFDILLLPNLYGDIVSDLCAGLVGGLGVVPAANLGTEIGVFEAVHGSAPDIRGQESRQSDGAAAVRRADASSHRRRARLPIGS